MTTIERFDLALKYDKFTIYEELEMINLLVKKYNFVSVSDYAKLNGISQPAALKRLQNGKVMYMEMIGRKFIINT